MNSSTLRRLASDHSSLHTAGLPPCYLFPQADASSLAPDDLTKLTVLLAGPQGTPYSQGLWKLCLKIPPDYPKSPPKAAFRTRIWHPNVEENTGHVCVDTLKRDWDPKLTLRDILITITCLLIHPNPDSALNASAGHLLHEDYDAFARQAHLMASIHARIPANLQDDVVVAKRRGEASSTASKNYVDQTPKLRTSSGLAGKRPNHLHLSSQPRTRELSRANIGRSEEFDDTSDSCAEDEASASKENDPSLSPSPVAIESPRISSSTKRPLSDLPTPTEDICDLKSSTSISPSEQNIPSNAPLISSPLGFAAPDGFCESLKLVERSRSVNYVGRALQETGKEGLVTMSLDSKANEVDYAPASKRLCSRDGKENGFEDFGICETATVAARPMLANGNVPVARLPAAITRKPMVNTATSSRTARPRVGLRRL